MSETKDTVRKQILSEEQSSSIGDCLLQVLNKPGIAPPLTPETMEQHRQWQQLCNVAMALSSRHMGLYQNELIEGTSKGKDSKKPGVKKQAKRTAGTRGNQRAKSQEKK